MNGYGDGIILKIIMACLKIKMAGNILYHFLRNIVECHLSEIEKKVAQVPRHLVKIPCYFYFGLIWWTRNLEHRRLCHLRLSSSCENCRVVSSLYSIERGYNIFYRVACCMQ